MNYFLKAIFAGIMIGIAALTSLGAGGSWYGSILFSIGLIIVCINGYNLYTGKVGYMQSYKDIPIMLTCILGNMLGICIVSLATNISTYDIAISKLSNPLSLIFLKSIFCGFLMYIAVNIYKENKSIVGILCCVPAFILSGFEHCIADMFYFLNSGINDMKSLLFLILSIIGNGVGALLHKIIK